MKRFFSIFLIIVMALTLVSCSNEAKKSTVPVSGAPAQQAENSSPAKKDDGKKIVGFLTATVSSLPLQVETSSFEKKAKEMGADEVIILSAEDSVETQINQMRDLITRGCDAIAIYTCDSDGIVPGVKAANAAGIPIIAVDRAINGGDIYYTIESNNIGDGRDIANHFGYMTAGEPEGSVEILNLIGNLSSIAQRERAEGFTAAAANLPQLKIVGEPATEADTEKTYNAVVDSFKTNPNIRGIVVAMDYLCGPVTNALKEIGKFYPAGDPKHVMLGGVDGGTEALQWLQGGDIDVSISLDFEKFGSMAAVSAMDYLDGKYVTNNKFQTASFICTRENVDQMAKNKLLWGLR